MYLVCNDDEVSVVKFEFIFNPVTYLDFAICGCLCETMLTFGKLTEILIISGT